MPGHETADAGRVTSNEKILSALFLFTTNIPEWTVEDAAQELNVSSSTAYRYFRSLNRFGLLVQSSVGHYVLGPGAIALDRQIRLSDPLLKAAQPIMRAIVVDYDGPSTALLSRRFRHQVVCVHQESAKPSPLTSSYERGRPMELFRGSASLTILAHLPTRTLRQLWESESDQIIASGLAQDLVTLRRALKKIRNDGVCVTYGQREPGAVGISSPLLDPQREIIGSLSVVVPESHSTKTDIAHLAQNVRDGAREVEANLASLLVR